MRNEKMKFKDLLYLWLEEVRTTLAPSTYVKYYRMSERYVLPYFSQLSILEVTVFELKKYREYLIQLTMTGQLEEGSVRCLIMIVNTVMNEAFKLKLIPDEVHILPGIRKRRQIVEVFSQEEQKKLENYLKEHIRSSTLAIYLCLYTGLRLGEICALRWECVHIKEGYLQVKSTVQRLEMIEKANFEENISFPKKEKKRKSCLMITAPKSSSSNRLVPIPSFLLPLLETYKTKSNPENFLLSESIETPMEPRTFQYQYKKCLAEAGIRYLNFHSVRHTFATRCIHVGMDPKTLSEILGHSDLKITLDYYFHSSFEFKKDQMERLVSIS